MTDNQQDDTDRADAGDDGESADGESADELDLPEPGGLRALAE